MKVNIDVVFFEKTLALRDKTWTFEVCCSTCI